MTETVVVKEQILPLGPAASQIAIKQLGTNGGGFFNANSSHPFENPTPLSNFLEMLAILLIPAALCYTFGKMVGDTRQGWAVLTAMTLIFCVLLGVALWSEHLGNPAFAKLAERRQHPGPFIGREYGGERGEIRHCQLGPLGCGHDRGLQWIRQLDARFLYPPWRNGSPVAYATGRGHLWGSRFGALRDAGVRHYCRLCRRFDGRAERRSTWERRSKRTR